MAIPRSAKHGASRDKKRERSIDLSVYIKVCNNIISQQNTVRDRDICTESSQKFSSHISQIVAKHALDQVLVSNIVFRVQTSKYSIFVYLCIYLKWHRVRVRTIFHLRFVLSGMSF